MIKMKKILLFATILILFIGIVSATDSVQEDQSGTSDKIADNKK